MLRQVLLIVVTVVTVFAASPAMAQPAGATQYGDCGVILMQDGEIYLASLEGPNFCPRQLTAWVQSANLFVVSGRQPGRIIAMTPNAQVLTAGGDWFQLNTGCPGTPLISFLGNVFELTGVVAAGGEEFTAFGGGQCVGYQYAATTHGNVFRWAGCMGWIHAGNLPIGPTSISAESWGTLKARYR